MSYLSNVSVTTKIVFVDANNSNPNIIHFLK